MCHFKNIILNVFRSDEAHVDICSQRERERERERERISITFSKQILLLGFPVYPMTTSLVLRPRQ